MFVLKSLQLEVAIQPLRGSEINNFGVIEKKAAKHELVISRHLARMNSLHERLFLIWTVMEKFEAASLNGTRTCLVFEPMREPL